MSHLALAFDPQTSGRLALALYSPAIHRLLPALSVPDDPHAPIPAIQALARSERYLFAVSTPFAHLGETEPSVLVFRRGDFLFEGRYRIGGLASGDGLCHWDGTLYIVSAASRAIVGFRADGPRLHPGPFHCRLPSLPNGSTLTAMTLHTCDYYVSAAEPGLVLNLTRGEVVATGLAHPGALLSVNNVLLIAETGADRIRSLDGRLQSPPIPSPRGLALLDDTLYTLSVPPSAPPAILALHPHTLEVRSSHPLPLIEPHSTPTDLIAVEEAGDWPEFPNTHWPTHPGRLFQPDQISGRHA